MVHLYSAYPTDLGFYSEKQHPCNICYITVYDTYVPPGTFTHTWSPVCIHTTRNIYTYVIKPANWVLILSVFTGQRFFLNFFITVITYSKYSVLSLLYISDFTPTSLIVLNWNGLILSCLKELKLLNDVDLRV